MDRPIAESQLATTLSQQLAMSHQGLQTRLQLNSPQRGTLDPELPNYQRTSKDVLLSPLQLTFAKGISFKIQNPLTRSLQSQLLVMGKMLNPLIVSQDLMSAMRQHRDILTTDPTIEMAWFANCIVSLSVEELTHFVSPHTFFILNVRFDRTQRRE